MYVRPESRPALITLIVDIDYLVTEQKNIKWLIQIILTILISSYRLRK